MTETRTEGRYCSQHRQPRSECRPGDRHVQPLRCADELFAQVEATGETLGLDRNAAAEQAFREFVERHGKAPAARTEPSAPVSVGAGPDLAATVAQLRREMDKLMAKDDEPLARARKRAAVAAPGTVLFLEPGAEPVASFPVPEVPARGQEGIAVSGDSYEWHHGPGAEQRGTTAREAGFGSIETTGVGADRPDGRPAFRVIRADPKILISDLMMDMIRGGHGFGAEIEGDLLRFTAVNGTWVYQIGEYLEDRRAWVAEWV